MSVDLIKDSIRVVSKEEALRLHLLIKSFHKGLNLSDSDINSLVELSEVGYNAEFFKACVAKGYYKSEQTVRNAIAKMTNMGILSYKKRGERVISEEFLPKLASDKVMFQYLIGNI